MQQREGHSVSMAIVLSPLQLRLSAKRLAELIHPLTRTSLQWLLCLAGRGNTPCADQVRPGNRRDRIRRGAL